MNNTMVQFPQGTGGNARFPHLGLILRIILLLCNLLFASVASSQSGIERGPVSAELKECFSNLAHISFVGPQSTDDDVVVADSRPIDGMFCVGLQVRQGSVGELSVWTFVADLEGSQILTLSDGNTVIRSSETEGSTNHFYYNNILYDAVITEGFYFIAFEGKGTLDLDFTFKNLAPCVDGAIPVSLAQRIDLAAIIEAQDIECTQLRLSQAGELRVGALSGFENFILVRTNPALSTLLPTSRSLDSGHRLTWSIPSAGTYVLIPYFHDNEFNPSENPSEDLHLMRVDFEAREEEECADQGRLQIGDIETGIFEDDDSGCHRFRLRSDQSSTAVFEFSVTGSSLTQIRILEGSREDIAAPVSDELTLPWPLQPSPTRYWVEVHGSGSYSLLVTRRESRADCSNPEPLVLGTTVENGRIGSASDVDCYAIAVPEYGEVRVRARTSLDAAVELLSVIAPAQRIAGVDSPSSGNESQISAVVERGRYIVRVRPLNRDTGTYRLEVEFTPLPDRHGDCSNPTRLSLTGTGEEEGRIANASDEDCFAITVPGHGKLTVLTTGNLNAMVELLSDHPQLSTLASGDSVTSGRNFVISGNVDEGSYHVRVRSIQGGVGTYRIRVTLALIDNHGDCYSPTAVEFSTPVRGHISPSDDIDCFRIGVPSPGTLRIWMAGDLQAGAELFGTTRGAVDFNARVAGDRAVDGGRPEISLELGRGAYYLQIGSLGGDTGAYELHVEFEPTEDNHGDCSDPTTWDFSGPVTGRISPANDIDCFRLLVTAYGELRVWTTGSTDTIGAVIAEPTVAGRRSNDDNGRDGVNFEIAWRVGAGYHLVEVRSPPGVTGTYELHAEFMPVEDDHGDCTDPTPLQFSIPIPGEIGPVDDVDCFRVSVSEYGTVQLWTTGDLDTVGELLVLQGDFGQVASAPGDRGRNFEISRVLQPDEYYLVVRSLGSDVGHYQVHAGFEPILLPRTRFSSGGGTVDAASSAPIGLTLEEPYSAEDIVGQFRLTMIPRVLREDLAVQWDAGGREIAFRVPQGATEAVFPGLGPNDPPRGEVEFQSGTVAGSIVVTARLRRASSEADSDSASESELVFDVAEAAPVLVRARFETVGQGRFGVSAVGYATSGEVNSLALDFQVGSGTQITGSNFVVDVSNQFRDYYSSDVSAAYGSMFSVRVEFDLVEGQLSNLAKVIVTATNGIGTSNAVEATPGN